jgi:hypothetical protein
MYKIDCREEAMINKINKEEYKKLLKNNNEKKSVKNDEKMKHLIFVKKNI